MSKKEVTGNAGLCGMGGGGVKWAGGEGTIGNAE